MARIKQFILRKYVMARSATEAIAKDRNYKVDEVFVDDQWLKEHPESPQSNIGYGKKK